MPEYIVSLWLDGYDTEEKMEEACDEFIYEQLNFTASSVRVKRSDYADLLAQHNALKDAVHKAMGRTVECDKKQTNEQLVSDVAYLKRLLVEARAEVDRLLNEGGE